jgi:hypothetical protein
MMSTVAANALFVVLIALSAQNTLQRIPEKFRLLNPLFGYVLLLPVAMEYFSHDGMELLGANPAAILGVTSIGLFFLLRAILYLCLMFSCRNYGIAASAPLAPGKMAWAWVASLADMLVVLAVAAIGVASRGAQRDVRYQTIVLIRIAAGAMLTGIVFSYLFLSKMTAYTKAVIESEREEAAGELPPPAR